MHITMKLAIFVVTVRCFVKCIVQDFDGKLIKPYFFAWIPLHVLHGLQELPLLVISSGKQKDR